MEILPNEDAKEALTNGVSAKRLMSSIMANRVGFGAMAGGASEDELSICDVVEVEEQSPEAGAGGEVYLKKMQGHPRINNDIDQASWVSFVTDRYYHLQQQQQQQNTGKQTADIFFGGKFKTLKKI